MQQVFRKYDPINSSPCFSEISRRRDRHLKPLSHFSGPQSGQAVVSVSAHLGQILLNFVDMHPIDWYWRDQNKVRSMMKKAQARVIERIRVGTSCVYGVDLRNMFEGARSAGEAAPMLLGVKQ